MNPDEDFEAWYRSNHSHVLASLAIACGDFEAACEATDEAFTRALERWMTVRDMRSSVGWVITVGLNRIRRAKRRSALERKLLPVLATATDKRTMDPLESHAIWSAVRNLPPRQRTAIALRYVADLPEDEIAALMGVHRGTVASTLSDAKHALARAGVTRD